jgi:hypothetical protein
MTTSLIWWRQLDQIWVFTNWLTLKLIHFKVDINFVLGVHQKASYASGDFDAEYLSGLVIPIPGSI